MIKSLLSTLTIGCLVFAGCSSPVQTEETDEFGLTIGNEEEEQAALIVQMKRVACEDSGGTFVEENCECPKDTELDGSPTYTLDEETGYCMDPFGLPGGILGEEEKAKHPLSQ